MWRSSPIRYSVLPDVAPLGGTEGRHQTVPILDQCHHQIRASPRRSSQRTAGAEPLPRSGARFSRLQKNARTVMGLRRVSGRQR